MGVQAFPSLLFFVLVFFVPESPRWLVKRRRDNEAEQVLRAIGEPEVETALQSIRLSVKSVGEERESLFSGKYNRPIMYVILLAMFNQLSGINAIMYYAPRIFEMTGLAKDTALLQAVSIGVTNMLATLLAISVIDRFGRKNLLITGSVGMVVCLGLVAYTFYTGQFGGYFVMLYLVGFIAFFAFSQGAVIWVFMAEIFPNKVRERGQTLGSFTHWIMAAGVSWLFPVIADKENGGFYSFLFFAVMMILHGVFAWKVIPETKGKSLEGIERSVLVH